MAYRVAHTIQRWNAGVAPKLKNDKKVGTRYLALPYTRSDMELDDAKDRRVTQLRKGILELAIIGVLSRGRHYGYSLVRVLSENGGASLKEGTVYPILARLDRDGVVHSEWVESAQGPPRKYYSLTAEGRRLLRELSQEFDLLISLVKQDKQEWTAQEPEEPEKKLFVRRR